MSEDDEKKAYRPEVYIIAGIAAAIRELPADSVKKLNLENDFGVLFHDSFGIFLSEEVLRETLELMDGLHLIKIDDDEFAGRFITVQKTAFSSQLNDVAEQLPGSAIEISLRAGKPWLQKAYSGEGLWKKLAEERDEDEQEDDAITMDAAVPASDRTVTLLHNSPERKEIEEGLDRVSEELRTNNQLAADLGDDRERITAEFEGVRSGIKTEKIRVGYIRDTVLKVLREMGGKLKEKAIDLGIDKLIKLFEIIIESII